jgi:hypothetical protein
MEGLAPNSKRARVMLYPMQLEVCWGGSVKEVKHIEVERHVSGGCSQGHWASHCDLRCVALCCAVLCCDVCCTLREGLS